MEHAEEKTGAPEKFMAFLQKARPVLNGVFGVAALAVGASLVLSAFTPAFFALPLFMGGLALAAGVESTWRSAREILPQKAQNFVSRLFTGKDAQPLKPLTMPGRAARILAYGTLATVGAIGVFLGAIGMIAGGGAAAASLYFGGGILALGGFPKAISQAVQYVHDAVKKTEGPVVADAAPGLNKDLAPAPQLQKGGAEAAFTVAAQPAETGTAPKAATASAPAAPAV